MDLSRKMPSQSHLNPKRCRAMSGSNRLPLTTVIIGILGKHGQHWATMVLPHQALIDGSNVGELVQGDHRPSFTSIIFIFFVLSASVLRGVPSAEAA